MYVCVCPAPGQTHDATEKVCVALYTLMFQCDTVADYVHQLHSQN